MESILVRYYEFKNFTKCLVNKTKIFLSRFCEEKRSKAMIEKMGF